MNPKVRVIQGDGIDYDVMRLVLGVMKDAHWSADNIAFGSGGGLLQKVNRDSQRFAFKCSAVNVNGGWRDVSKNPITDPEKKSKAGRLALVRMPNNGWSTIHSNGDSPSRDELIEVFCDGNIIKEQTFGEIRKRAAV